MVCRARRALLPRLLAALAVLTLVLLTVPVPYAAATDTGAGTFLRVSIERVSPDVLTTTSADDITVVATVTNVGDRPVRDVVARLERAPAVTTSAGLRTNLSGNVDQYRPVADFITLAPELDRGEEVTFTLSYPLRSSAEPALDISEPGIYPLMVNINGTPDYGAPARLDDSRFLLPVLGVPPDDDTESASAVSSVVPPDISAPVQFTVFWPLADQPRLAAGAPGGTTPVRLVDDELAVSLAPGGRLDTLLAAVDFATGPAVDPAGDVSRSLCLAVDPDLLVTVNAMTAGYVVNDGPEAGPGTPVRPGVGQDAAVNWLHRLEELTKRMCVASTVYGQADLDALERVADPGLSTIATRGATNIVDQILGITSTRGATLLTDGPLTGRAVELLASQGDTVAIAAADTAASNTATGLSASADLTPVRYRPTVVAAPFDPAVGAALAGAGSHPVTPTYLDPSLHIPLGGDSRVARRQDALGALLWRSLQPDVTPRAQILLPPPTWDLHAEDAQAILSAVATAIRAGLAEPRPLAQLIAETAAVSPTAAQPLPPARLGNPEARIDDAITAGIGAVTGRLWGLTAALTTDARTGLTGTGYTAPLREDMLRALSQSVPVDARNALARQRLDSVGGTVDNLFGAVTIVNPGDSYTLATERSPLPLALRNDLAVPIRVRLQVDPPPGMTVTDLGEIELPPGYLPLRVPVEVHFTQRFAVDVALTTADGLPLGEPVRLSVHSNAYGQVLFFITLSAGAVLILLAGRRLWHRFRGQPDPADLDRPDPLEVAMHYDDSESDPDSPAAGDEPPPRARSHTGVDSVAGPGGDA